MKFNIIQQESPIPFSGEKYYVTYGLSLKVEVTPQVRRYNLILDFYRLIRIFFLIAQMAYYFCLFRFYFGFLLNWQ